MPLVSSKILLYNLNLANQRIDKGLLLQTQTDRQREPAYGTARLSLPSRSTRIGESSRLNNRHPQDDLDTRFQRRRTKY